MNPLKQSFKSIDEAIGQLGHPDMVWLRGHTEMHRLLPWLFRLPNGIESERQIANRFLGGISNDETKNSSRSFEKIVEMHNSYVPTRLIDWTGNLYIALFCAIARELQAPTIFVLDPLKLNRLSDLNEIPDFRSLRRVTPYFSGWPMETTLPERPIAIGSGISQASPSGIFFTLHGSDRRPLEEQCADCVRKVVLTSEERSTAISYILSGEWRVDSTEGYPSV